MANKNLSDLLQEEAQKFTPTVGDVVIEVTAQKVVETETSSSEEESAPTSPRYTTAIKADLEVTIKELHETLEKYQTKEASLHQEISKLQSDLSAHKSLAEHLITELDATKKTALHLAESNSKLIAEINGLKQVKEPAKEPVKEPAKSLSINPKKSHRSPERLQEKPNQANDDFANNTWLYD